VCADGSVADGSYKEKGGDQEVFCQYDYSYTPAFDELCRVTGIYKRHL
jgi:hypothetical protein